MNLIQTTLIPISKLKVNSGQIDGLPKNPRFVKDAKYYQLKESIKDNPEMLPLRELVVVQLGKDFIVIGGNMRLRACKELGYKEMPCKVCPADMTIAQMKAFVIKDNVGFGDWDLDELANGDWDVGDLAKWGLDDVLSALSDNGAGDGGDDT